MKFGLLIQGPMLSIGRTGKTQDLPLNDPNAISTYSCTSNIQKIINNYGNLFEEIIVSTWDDDFSKTLDFGRGIKIVKTIDKGFDLPNRKGQLSNVDVININNQLRQYITTYEGLKLFRKSEVIIKIRTDQYIDLQSLTRHRIDFGKIYIPYLINNMSYIPDFYFIAKKETIMELFHALVSTSPLSSSPHINIVLCCAISKYFSKIGVEEGYYSGGETIEKRKIFAYMFENVFSPLPALVYSNITWRGDSFSSTYIKSFNTKKYVFSDVNTSFVYLVSNTPSLYEEVLFKTPNGLTNKRVQKIIRFIILSFLKAVKKIIF